jgi:hypothetical protein
MLRTKAIRSPAGDHAGCPTSCRVRVIRLRPVPSAPMTYRSLGASSRIARPVPANAIRLPSGAHVGQELP